MSEHMISMHPLDEMDTQLWLASELTWGELSSGEKRFVAEHQAVGITEKTSIEVCAETVCRLISVHIPQMNARFKDLATSQYYSNPVELIREESKRRENKKIWHTGNIADAHNRVDRLNKEIVSEETPGQMAKTLFWWLLFGLGFLALAFYNCYTGVAVTALNWIINATWFKITFILVTLGLSLYFGFFAIGVLIVGGVFLLAWVVLDWPGVAVVITSIILFVLAAILLLVAYVYLENIIKYKPLSEEEHRLNQERIAEKEALCRELEEYSDLMITGLDHMKRKFMDNSSAFHKEMLKHLGGNYDVGAVYEVFSFLERYYRKMKR